MNQENIIFKKGINAFNSRHFYDAHEFWEELWLDYKLPDATFIQGLIQLSVSYFHYYNGNLKGAKSMLKKCLTKFDCYNERVRGIDIIDLKSKIIDLQKLYFQIDSTSVNIDRYVITLKVSHE